MSLTSLGLGALSAKRRWRGPVGKAIRGEGVVQPHNDFHKSAPILGRVDQMRNPVLSRFAYGVSGSPVGLGLFSVPVGTPIDHLAKLGQAQTPLPGSREERASVLRQMLSALVSADHLDPRVAQHVPPEARPQPPSSMLKRLVSDIQHGFASGGSVHSDQARRSLFGMSGDSDYALRAQQQVTERLLGEQRLQNALGALNRGDVRISVSG